VSFLSFQGYRKDNNDKKDNNEEYVHAVRRVLRAGEEASKKNLKIAGGLMSRHYEPLQQAVQKVHDGAIGEPITCWSYREHGPVPFIPRSTGINELGHQIRNYSCFTWLNGSFILDWLIHNLDVCCWVKSAWPESAQGQGGRQVRTIPDQLFDHYAVEYTFADGTRLCAQGRHMADCWHFWGNVIQGTRGSAVLGEGISVPKLYRGYKQSQENLVWRYSGPSCNAYQTEHDRLFQAIREDKPYNETERCAKATLVGILGRLAAHSGQLVTWDDALASEAELAPGLEQLTWESDAPVLPDAEGRYTVAMPGMTRAV
jgi:predicted dehydrogenase